MHYNFIEPNLQRQYCMSSSLATSKSRRKPLMQCGFIGPKLKTLSGYQEFPIPNLERVLWWGKMVAVLQKVICITRWPSSLKLPASKCLQTWCCKISWNWRIHTVKSFRILLESYRNWKMLNVIWFWYDSTRLRNLCVLLNSSWCCKIMHSSSLK